MINDIDTPRAGAELPPAVSGERFETRGSAGRVACYVAGSGPPLNAATVSIRRD